MKIGQSSLQNNHIDRTEGTIEIKKGDVLSSTIKERLPNNESVIQIRGKDVRVQFEGSIPTNDKVTVQVVGEKDGIPQVRAVVDRSKGQNSDSDISRILRSLGASATPELKTAVKFLLDRGLPLSRESVASLKAFLEEKIGNVTQKLETIKAIANKGLELTPIHLRSVHAALHGKPIGGQLADLAETLGLEPLIGANEENVGTELISQRDGINHSIEVERASLTETKTPQEGMKEVNEMAVRDLNLADSVDQYRLSDEILAGLKPETKDIVITHVTQRMAQAAEQFKELKREVTRNLDNMVRVAEATRVNIFPQMKQVMESTVDLIDKAILKSDFVMFADMFTEKQLMNVSMDLATAKKHLANGQNDQAAALLSKIKTTLLELNWQPADVKVRHVLTNEQMVREGNSSKHELTHLIDHVSRPENPAGSARGTFELIRSLGLNYDSEIAQSLVTANDRGNEEQIQQNMKAAMLKLVGNEGDQAIIPSADQQVREIVQNLTGQQLLNRSEPGSPLQTMFFSLPLMMGANMETVKLYVNAKKEGEKIDWENCSLYFLIDTKKIGETGILLTANNRNLSITIKNDRQELKQKMETLVDKCKENLKEIGYNITTINFTRLSNEKEIPSEKSNEPSVPINRTTTKGFDFSV